MTRIREAASSHPGDIEAELRTLFLCGLEGEQAAYRAFLQKLSAHLRVFLRRRLFGWPDEVEDLVQECRLAMHNKRHTYQSDQPLTAWVHATLAWLARPGVGARTGKRAIAAPILLVWLMVIAAYASAPPSERAAMVWGQSWRICTLSVLMISVPVFVAAFLALRRLAPTRLVRTGACAGVLSGAAGAAIHAFHGPETALPFMAIWYVAGIAMAAGIGAALGPRLLRW